MKYRKAYLFFCGFLIAASILLSACRSGSASPDEESSATTPGTAESVVETPTSASELATPEAEEDLANVTSEGGPIINEDVRRSALFNINTLAYELSGMEEVEVINVTYAFHEEQPLTVDVYYPPDTPADAQLPVVVFGLGYRMSSESLRDAHFNTSWGRLVAAAGMVAISYDTEQPDRDLETLIAFIQDNATALRVDPERIGFHSSSANVPTVMSYLMQEGRSGIQFGVYYYGHSLTPDRKYGEGFGASCALRGCLFDELADVTYVDPDLPLFIVKAGRDFVPNINEAWDHFVAYVREAGAPVTVVEYEDGRHGFDTQQKTEESAEIIALTIDFMKTNLGLDAQDTSSVAPGEARGVETPLVLHNGVVVQANGSDPISDGAIVVQNGLITAVGPEAEISFPEGATVIDVEGRTMLPGLIDARASDLLNRLDLDGSKIGDVPLAVYLRDTLDGGVTTVRATGWNWEEQQEIAELRAALTAQGNSIPTVVIAGTSLAHGDGSAADTYAHQTVGVITVEEAAEITERLIDFGVDQIGFLLSITQESHLESREGLPPILSADQIEAIVDAAHSQGKWVAGQAVFPEEAVLALAAGVDELLSWPSRAQPIPEAVVQTLVDGSVPVVSGFNITPPQEGDVRRFLDAGGTLVFGTYAPNSGPLSNPYREFQIMAVNDMTAMEMILSATANAAHSVGLGDVTGTLEIGKQADIIVVDGDPFEDFRVMRDVVYVIKGGELVAQPEEE